MIRRKREELSVLIKDDDTCFAHLFFHPTMYRKSCFLSLAFKFHLRPPIHIDLSLTKITAADDSVGEGDNAITNTLLLLLLLLLRL